MSLISEIELQNVIEDFNEIMDIVRSRHLSVIVYCLYMSKLINK